MGQVEKKNNHSFKKNYPQANNRERKLKHCWQKRKLEEADQITFLSSRNNNNSTLTVVKNKTFLSSSTYK